MYFNYLKAQITHSIPTENGIAYKDGSCLMPSKLTQSIFNPLKWYDLYGMKIA